jgi:nucleoid DNA-binding protein
MYLRVIPQATINKSQLVANISKSTLINRPDVEAVLASFQDETVDALINGNRLSIDDFIGFSVSIKLRDGVTITNKRYDLNPDDIVVQVNARVKRAITRRVRDRLRERDDFRKVHPRKRLPLPESVYDVLSKTEGQYTPGGPLEIYGVELELPDDVETNLDVGVFFESGGVETRADNYMAAGNQKIVCIVPPSISGDVRLIVRCNYGSTAIHKGELSSIPQAP